MRRSMRAVTYLLSASLWASSAGADVIPSRVSDEKSPAARAEVARQLVHLGLDLQQAQAHVKSLTEGDVARFAAMPGAMRLAGQAGPAAGRDFFAGESSNLWYETVGGILGLAFAVALIAIVVTNNE